LEAERNCKGLARYQTPEERREDIRSDLMGSKECIERRLDKPVRHLCYPWFLGSSLAVRISREVGYTCNYWGIHGRKAVNQVGDDPYYIRRLNDIFIFSLPGKGRIPLGRLISFKLKKEISAHVKF
jgi:peptidoglycan/xylan/chitin deacetylase (PgdA/CDA1 family)